MRSPSYTGQFKRDVKLAQKRGKDLAKLRAVIELLLAGETLPRDLGDHPLKGEWQPSRDLHLEVDWLLIYRVTRNRIVFHRTGTHRELFRTRKKR